MAKALLEIWATSSLSATRKYTLHKNAHCKHHLNSGSLRAFTWAYHIFTPTNNSTADIRQNMILNYFLLLKNYDIQIELSLIQYKIKFLVYYQ